MCWKAAGHELFSEFSAGRSPDETFVLLFETGAKRLCLFIIIQKPPWVLGKKLFVSCCWIYSLPYLKRVNKWQSTKEWRDVCVWSGCRLLHQTDICVVVAHPSHSASGFFTHPSSKYTPLEKPLEKTPPSSTQLAKNILPGPPSTPTPPCAFLSVLTHIIWLLCLPHFFHSCTQHQFIILH